MFERYTTPSKLRHKGIMGMNKRNHSYIGRYNDRSKYPLVDDKLKPRSSLKLQGQPSLPLSA